ncbi:MAG: hypothetical protein AAFX87_24140 [Bacteroidota bacterium]
MEEILDLPDDAGNGKDYISKELIDGRELQIFCDFANPLKGDKVQVNYDEAADGCYRIRHENKRYEVQDGKILAAFYVETYKQKIGHPIEVDGSIINGINAGSRVWIEDRPAPDGTYRMGTFRKILVANGRILKIKLF